MLALGTQSWAHIAALANWSYYWHGFLKFWGDFFGRQNGVIMLVLTIAAISVFIICYGRSRK